MPKGHSLGISRQQEKIIANVNINLIAKHHIYLYTLKYLIQSYQRSLDDFGQIER